MSFVEGCVTNMNLNKIVFRAWYYFRTGYAIYISFLVGLISNIIVIYSLGIKPVIAATEPSTLGSVFEFLFPHLINFAVIAILISVPLCVYIGVLHMKRTGAYEADASVATEEHPYAYKAVPGKEQEVFVPLMMLTAQSMMTLLEQQSRLTPELKKQMDEAIEKAKTLIEGKGVGKRK